MNEAKPSVNEGQWKLGNTLGAFKQRFVVGPNRIVMYRSLCDEPLAQFRSRSDHNRSTCEDCLQVFVCVLSPMYSSEHLNEFIDDLLGLRFNVIKVCLSVFSFLQL